MGNRLRSQDRCAICHMRRDLCLCAEMPRLANASRVVVLIHALETKRTTNTGSLATLALVNSEMRVRGRLNETFDAEALVAPGATGLLLYPSDDAVVLTADAFVRPVTLLVPDGNWRQAGKMGKREPALAKFARVKLPPGPPTEYQLRREHMHGGLATLEAIARALGILDGPHIQRGLEAIFREMVRRTVVSRGRTPVFNPPLVFNDAD